MKLAETNCSMLLSIVEVYFGYKNGKECLLSPSKFQDCAMLRDEVINRAEAIIIKGFYWCISSF